MEREQETTSRSNWGKKGAVEEKRSRSSDEEREQEAKRSGRGEEKLKQ